ncbi:Spc98 family-domain-containing protein [Crepidotus variabilis]|uniref:Spindle pole body component n=1 Tax=Crepidotus variabilis TaxID=179855 RepID=A0A9P6EUT3_9AGAR|nr:Spc98 family-domain-containing protein [Crepidotus variabilis]
MIAEVLLVLAGHSSSLFPTDYTLNSAIAPLLHPGEQQSLEALGLIAYRYRKIKSCCNKLSHSPSRYICALCATLSHVMKDEYESLVIQTEVKVLKRDSELVASGAFVPLSAIRSIFSEWDAPLAALSALVDELEADNDWKPGPLIDLLVTRSKTGIHRIAQIMSKLSVAVQRVWRTQLTAFLVHGSLSATDPLAGEDFSIVFGAIPSCVSAQSRDSIGYIGRAVATVKAVKWQKQPPRELANDHTRMLEEVLPEDQHAFDLVISEIRTNIGEWLWLNVLTKRDVDEAVDSLANYFLIRNGEFSLSLIREIERLKTSRLTSRHGTASMIRDQDLNLALLRASLGTTAQHDPYLSRLRFVLPGGPVRPLLPSLTNDVPASTTSPANSLAASIFDTSLLGTTMSLTYSLSWPLDLFLDKADLAIYSSIFSFLSALRKTHTRIHTCWTSLSNAQRARRRWTGLGEGGMAEDLDVRAKMLRCGWGVVRDMGWFLDTLLGYVMMDVVDVEFRKMKDLLDKQREVAEARKATGPQATPTTHLDFTTLRTIHTNYLARLVDGCLLSNGSLTTTTKQILDICERFVAVVERWGGDVLPALLFEGSIMGSGQQEVGTMVKERWVIVAEIEENLRSLMELFYEQLTQSMSQPFSTTVDASKSGFLGGVSMINQTTHTFSKTAKAIEGEMDQSRRHVERLLLRLDFNGELSRPRSSKGKGGGDILAEGGLA